MIVLPVRIIMSPTSSSRLFAGRKARSATVRTNSSPQGCGAARRGRRRRRLCDGQHEAQTRTVTRTCATARNPVVRSPAPMRVWVALALAGLALAGCGSERQDENEPEGEFAYEVVEASFPARQSTAQHSTMRIAVRNTDDRNLPNRAVTLDTEQPGGGDPAGAFATAATDPRLADPSRPVWIVDRGPTGGDSAATNTWAV